jgi:hypothetical protein
MRFKIRTRKGIKKGVVLTVKKQVAEQVSKMLASTTTTSPTQLITRSKSGVTDDSKTSGPGTKEYPILKTIVHLEHVQGLCYDLETVFQSNANQDLKYIEF